MLSIGFCKFVDEKYRLENNYSSDRFRTAINVFGDSIGCAIVQHLSRKELSTLDGESSTVNTNGVLISKSDQEVDSIIDHTKL